MGDEPLELKTPIVQKAFNVGELEHRPAPNFLQVYANSASFGVNFFELSILFGQITTASPSKMNVEERVTVTMSLEHAKALANALQEALTNYEKSHASIRKAPTMDKV